MLLRYIIREKQFPLGKGNTAASSHLCHNMPGHRSKSHTNNVFSLGLSLTLLPYKHKWLWCCGCSHFGLVCPTQTHLLCGESFTVPYAFQQHGRPLYSTSYIWLHSGYHTFCLRFHMCSSAGKGSEHASNVLTLNICRYKSLWVLVCCDAAVRDLKQIWSSSAWWEKLYSSFPSFIALLSRPHFILLSFPNTKHLTPSTHNHMHFGVVSSS